MVVVYAQPGRITVTGHAGQGPIGQDVVCAGVSALTVNLINSIGVLTGDKIRHHAVPGKTEIAFKNLSEKAKLLVDSFLLGVQSIADEYPENVSVVDDRDFKAMARAQERAGAERKKNEF